MYDFQPKSIVLGLEKEEKRYFDTGLLRISVLLHMIKSGLRSFPNSHILYFGYGREMIMKTLLIHEFLI